MCSLINSKDDEDFKTYKIEVSSLAEYIGIDKKSALRELDRVTDNLMSRVLRIPVDNGEKLLKVHWVSHCLMSDKYVEFSFSPKMKPYLLKLRRQFASHRFSAIVSFRSSYTIRLYQLLKVYLFEGSYKCSVEKLRDILEVGDAYKEFKEFKRNVLAPAKKEFEKKNKDAGGYMSDITFDLETLRSGRKITDLVFHIREQQYQERLPIEIPEATVADDSANTAIEALERYGIKGEIAQKYLDLQEEEEILRCVELLEQAKASRKVKSSESGYLLTLLEARAGKKTRAELEAETQALKEAEAKNQSEKQAQEQKRREALEADFSKEMVSKFIDSLSEVEQQALLKEIQQEYPAKDLNGGLSRSYIITKNKIPNYEQEKIAYIAEHLK